MIGQIPIRSENAKPSSSESSSDSSSDSSGDESEASETMVYGMKLVSTITHEDLADRWKTFGSMWMVVREALVQIGDTAAHTAPGSCPRPAREDLTVPLSRSLVMREYHLWRVLSEEANMAIRLRVWETWVVLFACIVGLDEARDSLAHRDLMQTRTDGYYVHVDRQEVEVGDEVKYSDTYSGIDVCRIAKMELMDAWEMVINIGRESRQKNVEHVHYLMSG